MEIKTKFAIGDRLWTIHNFKATEIEVVAIVIDAHEISVRAKEDYATFPEDNCFITKESLIKHLMGD